MSESTNENILEKIKWYKYIDYSKNNRFNVFPLQFADSLRICFNDIIYLFHETGTGKTVISGMSVLNYFDFNKFNQMKVLVVTNNDTCVENFKRDWAMLPFNSFEYNNKIDYTIINNHFKSIEKAVRTEYDLIIVDEAHLFISNAEQKRCQQLENLKSKKIIFMTATPVRYKRNDIETYQRIGQKILKNSGISDNIKTDLNNCLKNQKFLPSVFNISLPVSRYFKDTVERSKKSSSKRLKRIEPALWINDKSNEKNFYHWVAEKIKKEIDHGNRFVVFIDTINSKDSQAEKLGKNLENLSYQIITAEDKYKLLKYDISNDNYKNEETPDVLIIAKVADTGINLNSFNRILNISIPSVPAVIEQRFGRIDRLIDENTYKKRFENNNPPYRWENGIQCIFAFTSETPQELRFYQAVSNFIDDILSFFPCRNILLTENILTRYKNSIEKNIGFYKSFVKFFESQECWKNIKMEIIKENDSLQEENKYRISSYCTDIISSYCNDINSINKYQIFLILEYIKEYYGDKIIYCNNEEEIFEEIKQNCKEYFENVLNKYIKSNEKMEDLEQLLDNSEIWDNIFYKETVESNNIAVKKTEEVYKDLSENESYNSFEEELYSKMNKFIKKAKAFSKYSKRLEGCFEEIFFNKTNLICICYMGVLKNYIWPDNCKPILEDPIEKFLKRLNNNEINEFFDDTDLKNAFEDELKEAKVKDFKDLPVNYFLPFLSSLPIYIVTDLFEKSLRETLKTYNGSIRHKGFYLPCLDNALERINDNNLYNKFIQNIEKLKEKNDRYYIIKENNSVSFSSWFLIARHILSLEISKWEEIRFKQDILEKIISPFCTDNNFNVTQFMQMAIHSNGEERRCLDYYLSTYECAHIYASVYAYYVITTNYKYTYWKEERNKDTKNAFAQMLCIAIGRYSGKVYDGYYVGSKKQQLRKLINGVILQVYKNSKVFICEKKNETIEDFILSQYDEIMKNDSQLNQLKERLKNWQKEIDEYHKNIEREEFAMINAMLASQQCFKQVDNIKFLCACAKIYHDYPNIINSIFLHDSYSIDAFKNYFESCEKIQFKIVENFDENSTQDIIIELN